MKLQKLKSKTTQRKTFRPRTLHSAAAKAVIEYYLNGVQQDHTGQNYRLGYTAGGVEVKVPYTDDKIEAKVPRGFRFLGMKWA